MTNETFDGYRDSVSRVIRGFIDEIAEIDRAVARLQGKRAALIDTIDTLESRLIAAEEHGVTATASESAPPKRKVPYTETLRAHLRRRPDRWFTAKDLREEAQLPAPNISSSLAFMLKKGEVERRALEEGEQFTPGRAHWEYRWVGDEEHPVVGFPSQKEAAGG